MIKTLFNLLYLIYVNRYRKLTYKDESKFYILLFIYGIGFYQLWVKDFEYKEMFFYILIITQTTNVLQRRDYKLLKKQIGYFYTHILVFIDILIFNLPLIGYFLYSSIFHLMIIIGGLLFTPLILNIPKIKSSHLRLFRITDPLWSSHIRTKPWEYILLFFSLFLQYQGIINENEGLHLAGLYIIYFLIHQVYSEKESLYFYKFSKISYSTILLNLFKNNILYYLYLLAPSLLMILFYYSVSYVINVIYFFISALLLFWIRYIFFRNNLLKSVVVFILMFMLISNRLTSDFPIHIIILVGVLNLILYRIAKVKFEKLVCHKK